jgi:hypothetical protein
VPNFNLRALRKTEFQKIYEKLHFAMDLNFKESFGLLQIATLLLKSKHREMRNFGQRIITLYSLKTHDYRPLYEISLQLGLSPLVRLLEKKYVNSDFASESDTRVDFHEEFVSSINETYGNGDIFYTEEQYWINQQYNEDENLESLSLVAPTSYGKSDLMLSSLKNSKNNVCILVPTKALIAQTKRRILSNVELFNKRRLITHPEMFLVGAQKFIAVLTQERFLRLLRLNREAQFEMILVDEAHNLLEGDSRSAILASSLIIAKARNKSCKIKYFTPFIVNSKLLKLRHAEFEIKEIKVHEYLKTETYYVYDFADSEGLLIYDQFLDDFIKTDVENYRNEIELVRLNRANKNIIYLNRPPSIEVVAKRLAQSEDIKNSELIEKACAALSDYVHENYYLISCLKKGVVYHHGSVPDTIKLYIENLFSRESKIHYIVTTSTLLEGVNIPAERIFLLDYKKGTRKLTPSQFKNLVGRVCRFKELFDSKNGTIELIAPKVYLVKSEFMFSSANIKNFISDSVKEDLKIIDEVDNVLLVESSDKDHNKTKAADEFIENLEPGTIQNSENIRIAETDFGKLCFANGLHELDILEVEYECQGIVDSILASELQAETANEVIDLINRIFIPFVKDKNLLRLSEEKAAKFYSMFLEWKMENHSFKEMIGSFLSYWRKFEKSASFVFVGSKWGEVAIEGAFVEMWVDIRSKSEVERINLAIVKIKEEQEFLDNNIIKFTEVLNDLKIINEKTFLKIKYGTIDEKKIVLLKNGISSSLSSLLLSEKYKMFVKLDETNSSVTIDPAIKATMEKNRENDLVLFELSYVI